MLGRPQGTEEALFEGAELPLKVRGQPARDDAPIRVYAARDAIYVTCGGASLLGLHPAVLDPSEFEAPAPDASLTGTEAEFMTFGPGALGANEEAAILTRARLARRGVDRRLP